MMYADFSAGNKEYKLRLDTRNTIALEKRLGCNPVAIFGMDGETIPTVGTMVAILHAALQPYNHGITVDDAFGIFDKWIEDGNNTMEFVKVILEIFKVSGIIPNDVEKTEEIEKN